MATRETVLPLPSGADRVPVATEIRSTTLISSLNALRGLEVADSYFGLVPREHGEAMRQLVAGVWVPMAIGMTHYEAVERLRLTDDQARENGRRVAQGVQNSHFGTLVRTLGATVTPWTVLPRVHSFVGRLVNGGACAVYREGPKDARVEIHGVPIARFAYVRLGWAGMFEGTLSLLVRKVYVRDQSPPGTRTVAAYSVAWA
jgi:hypothetical protein